VQKYFFKKNINYYDFKIIKELLLKYNIKEKSHSFISNYINRCNELLNKLPNNIYNDCLKYIVYYANNREN